MKFVISIISSLIFLSCILLPPFYFKKKTGTSLQIKTVLVTATFYIMIGYAFVNAVYAALLSTFPIMNNIYLSSLLNGFVYAVVLVISYLMIFKLFFRGEVDDLTAQSLGYGMAIGQAIITLSGQIITYDIVSFHILNNTLVQWLMSTMEGLNEAEVLAIAEQYQNISVLYIVFLGISAYAIIICQMQVVKKVTSFNKSGNKIELLFGLLFLFIFGTLYHALPSINFFIAIVCVILYIIISFRCFNKLLFTECKKAN